MSNRLRTIADALAEGLGDVTFSPAATVQRKNWAAVDIEDMANPVIYVVPGNAEVTRVSRSVSQFDYLVNVFIGRHCQTDAEVDGMMDLADSVLLYIRAHDWGGVTFPTGVTSPQSVSININPDDALNDRNVWRAVIEARYIVFEADALPET
jgi:hypothetical protein